MPDKQIRCNARKAKPTCEKNPDVCLWDGEKCSYKNPAKKPCGNKKKESTSQRRRLRMDEQCLPAKSCCCI